LSDGRKKEIYQYIRFFHGALQLLLFPVEAKLRSSCLLWIMLLSCWCFISCDIALQQSEITAEWTTRQKHSSSQNTVCWRRCHCWRQRVWTV